MTHAPQRRAFLLDANLFVAAVKLLPRQTASFALLAALLADPEGMLVADDVLLGEYERYAARFRSPAAQELLFRLRGRCTRIEVRPTSLRRVLPFFGAKQWADAFHAAACLQADAVLVTADRDFARLASSGLVDVWSPTQAIRAMKPSS